MMREGEERSHDDCGCHGLDDSNAKRKSWVVARTALGWCGQRAMLCRVWLVDLGSGREEEPRFP